MADIVQQLLARPIQLADKVIKSSDEAQSFKQECQELKMKTEKLAGLLRQAARSGNDLYERPTRRIVDEIEQVIDKALTLVTKCEGNSLLKRMFTIIPATAFRKLSIQIENSIADVSWLLRVSASGDDRDDGYLGLPPIAANEPILCLIWEQIAVLCSRSVDERSDAAASLVSLARDNDRYGKLILEEGGVPPLLKLVKEGNMEGQENAARAIGLLGRDPESVEQIVNAGACNVFAKILKDGQMKVQAMVAWAVSELAAHHPKCQEPFAQNNVIRFLVSHLAFETVQEHSKYAIASKQNTSLHSVLMASNAAAPKNGDEPENNEEHLAKISHPMNNQTPSQMQSVVSNTMAMRAQVTGNGNLKPPTIGHDQPPQSRSQARGAKETPARHEGSHTRHASLMASSIKGREYEDPVTKANMKAMAARAIWQLCKGNFGICRSVTESRALLCLAILLEKGAEDVQFYSAMALMEITAVAEEHAELRRSAFKPTAPAAKAVVDQLLKVIEAEDSRLLMPCVKAIGNLARTFRATETRITAPLVKFLENEREPEISMEAAIALIKFASTENYLSTNHSISILHAGAVKHLVQLIYFGEQMVQFPSLMLLCYIALNCPDSEVLANEDVLIVLDWSTKQPHLTEEPELEHLLPEAKSRLELYQSRVSRGFH